MFCHRWTPDLRAHTHAAPHTPQPSHIHSCQLFTQDNTMREGAPRLPQCDRALTAEPLHRADMMPDLNIQQQFKIHVSLKCPHQHQNHSTLGNLCMYSWTQPGWKGMFHTGTKLVLPFVWHLQTIRLPHCPLEVNTSIKSMWGEDRSCTVRELG